MYKGWNSWRIWAEEQRRVAHMLKGAIKRMLLRKVPDFRICLRVLWM